MFIIALGSGFCAYTVGRRALAHENVVWSKSYKKTGIAHQYDYKYPGYPRVSECLPTLFVHVGTGGQGWAGSKGGRCHVAPEPESPKASECGAMRVRLCRLRLPVSLTNAAAWRRGGCGLSGVQNRGRRRQARPSPDGRPPLTCPARFLSPRCLRPAPQDAISAAPVCASRWPLFVSIPCS